MANTSFPVTVNAPATDGATVVAGTNFVVPARAIYVGGTGDVTVTSLAGNNVLFSAVPVGTILPIQCTKVNSSGTTATLMTALW